MIVRIEIHHYTGPEPYWQLKRCQAQVNGEMQDVSDPGFFRPIRFATLEEAIRHAKIATFTFLEKRQHKEMPDQMDWRIYEDERVCPCPVCRQPLYRKAKLARTGNHLDLRDWGCSRCKKTVTLNTDGLLSTASTSFQRTTSFFPILPSHDRIIPIPGETWHSTRHADSLAAAVIAPIVDRR